MIAVHVARERPEAITIALDLAERLAAVGLSTVGADAADAAALGVPEAGTGPGTLRAVVAVGGDGTVLEGVHHALAAGCPLTGVNVGRVGFLAETEPDRLESLVAVLASDNPPVVPRMGIAASIAGTDAVGLNDVVIQKVAGRHMVAVDILVDGVRFLTYRADGVIISTPTGSSAYTLSAGGPLLDPRIDALVVTPIAPYSLFRASVALHPDATLECTTILDHAASITVDGRDLGTVAPGETVTVRRGPDIPFLDVLGRSYPEALKAKLRLHEGLDGVLGDPDRR
jgi:NAD+ kinase